VLGDGSAGTSPRLAARSTVRLGNAGGAGRYDCMYATVQPRTAVATFFPRQGATAETSLDERRSHFGATAHTSAMLFNDGARHRRDASSGSSRGLEIRADPAGSAV
jgi:hypothetical protein